MPEDKEKLIKELVLKYSLENAVKHKGTVNEKSVMQKIMATHAELRKDAKLVIEIVETTAASVNALDSEKQIAQLEKIAPELLEQKDSGKRVFDLPDLDNATSFINSIGKRSERFLI